MQELMSSRFQGPSSFMLTLTRLCFPRVAFLRVQRAEGTTTWRRRWRSACRGARTRVAMVWQMPQLRSDGQTPCACAGCGVLVCIYTVTSYTHRHILETAAVGAASEVVMRYHSS